MSVQRGNGQNGGHFYSNITKPVKLDLSFVVDSTNVNGLGISSLKSNGYVRNVFMHTSATPGSNDGALNPNPAVGFAVIQFKNNYNYYLGGFEAHVSPTAGGALAATTNHLTYVINAVGTTTAAQWLAAGVPAGVTPAVGVAFVAIKTGALGGTGTVKVPGVSSIVSVEVIGNPNVSNANTAVGANGGAYLLIQFLAATDASTTTLIPTNPADATVVSLSAFFDASSVTIDGL